jgi:hypothetical protein
MSKKNAITVSFSSDSYDFVTKKSSEVGENRKPSNFIDTTIFLIAPIWERLEKGKGTKLTLSEVMAELDKLVPK